MTQEDFKMLFESHFEDIRRYLYFRSGDPALSSDIAQETFLKVWEKQLQLEPFKDAALLYKISGDLLVSHLRRQNLAKKIQQEMVLHPAEDADRDLKTDELRQNYQRALMKMNENQRVVFMMSRMEDLTYREIAERLGIGIKAVEKRMKHALTFLRRELEMK